MKNLYKIILALLCMVAGAQYAVAQQKAPEVKFRNDYYDTRRAAHDKEQIPAGAVVFIGNSITEQGWWNLLLGRDEIVNRGIGGDNTFGIIDRLPDILKTKPSKIFLMAGVNDLTAGRSVDTIFHNIVTIVDMAAEAAPCCEFYIQSALPVNDSVLAYPAIKGKNGLIRELNARLEKYCGSGKAVYVDIHALLEDGNGELREELTKDGIHLHPEAYEIWAGYLKSKGYLK